MNLHELRTPHPLHEADFAAIRARVKAEVARERTWLPILLRFAFAASLLVLFVPYVKESTPDVPVQVVMRSVGRAEATPPLSNRAIQKAKALPPHSKPPRPAVHAQAERIEIITEDPTIRIIWLTPKEKDS